MELRRSNSRHGMWIVVQSVLDIEKQGVQFQGIFLVILNFLYDEFEMGYLGELDNYMCLPRDSIYEMKFIAKEDDFVGDFDKETECLSIQRDADFWVDNYGYFMIL